MRKTLPFLVVGILVLSGLGAVATIDEDLNFEQTSIFFSQPILKSEDQYISVNLIEANSYLMSQGKPLLPSYEQSYSYPFGTKIKSITITPKNIQEITLPNKISPTPKMVQVGQKVEINSDVVNYGNQPYPSNWYAYKVFSGIDGKERKTILKIETYPVKYFPNENKIEWANTFDINIAYETPIEPQNFADDYSFVILTPSEFSSSLSTLSSFKIGKGITTKVVTLTEVNSGTYFPVTGRDDQEKIKYFIKNAIENWGTINVLIVGSSTKFPIRLTHVYIEDDPQYGDEIFVSDLYYADIYDGDGNFCSWDSNGNNNFGEYNWQGQYDDVDLHPDVNLGRWAVRGSSDLSSCINKDIAYENLIPYQQEWFLNLVTCGGDSFEDTSSVDEGEYVNQKVIDLMTGFNPIKLWASNGELSGTIPSGVANIKDAIDAGCGFVDFSGHGNTNIWATHPHENFGTWLPTPFPGGFWSANANTLANGNELPIVTIEACSTAKFNVDQNCLNWAFMYHDNGGAIGIFGATGLGYGYVGAGVIQGLIGKMGLDTFRAYKTSGAQNFGEMWSKALNRYIKVSMNDGDYKTVEEWQPFGDPTIAIGTPEVSNPPAKPSKPYGPLSGGTGTPYTYSTSATDPDSDMVYYMFDWGDGTTSGWVGPYTSGAQGQATKTWKKSGTWQIKAVAKDEHGKLSEWSDPLSVSIPRSRPRFFSGIQGTFTAVMGLTGDPDPTINLNGQFRIRTRYTVFGGIATYQNLEKRFMGIFFNNHFAIKIPIQDRTILIIGRCTFDENHETFTGQWRTRSNNLNGWINGELSSS